MKLSDINFRAEARAFCREKDFTNVDLIEAAMQRGAERVIASASELMQKTLDDLKKAHANNLKPQ